MCAPLNDAAVVQHHDGVGVLDRGEPVGNDEHRAAFHQSVHALLDNGLGVGVDGRGCLVQDHHGRVGHSGPGNGQQLPLALGQVGAVALQGGVIAIGQTGDEVVSAGQLGGGNAFLVGGVQTAIADVFHHGAGEQVGVLEHHAQRPPEVRLFDLIDIDVIVTDLAVGDIVEPVDQVGNGGLAGAGGTHEGHFLAGFGVQADVVQHHFVRCVAEIHVKELYIALQAGVGHGAVAVGMFPSPQVSAFAALGEAAVFALFGVDQGHIAFVGFHLLIH